MGREKEDRWINKQVKQVHRQMDGHSDGQVDDRYGRDRQADRQVGSEPLYHLAPPTPWPQPSHEGMSVLHTNVDQTHR